MSTIKMEHRQENLFIYGRDHKLKYTQSNKEQIKLIASFVGKRVLFLNRYSVDKIKSGNYVNYLKKKLDIDVQEIDPNNSIMKIKDQIITYLYNEKKNSFMVYGNANFEINFYTNDVFGIRNFVKECNKSLKNVKISYSPKEIN